MIYMCIYIYILKNYIKANILIFALRIFGSQPDALEYVFNQSVHKIENHGVQC